MENCGVEERFSSEVEPAGAADSAARTNSCAGVGSTSPEEVCGVAAVGVSCCGVGGEWSLGAEAEL